jgi:uncharacterized tellurite resistance protein B-like protein
MFFHILIHSHRLYLFQTPRYIFSMFDVLKSIFSDSPDAVLKDASFGPEDRRLAEAALMFHVIAADGEIRPEERDKMLEILSRQYEFSSEEMTEIFDAAAKADSESVDLYRFTSVLKKALDRDQRIAIIERLWEVVFADGKMHEFEDNVVWRIAQLMEVETVDRVAMKQRVRARLRLQESS